jgi:hypothetical protein
MQSMRRTERLLTEYSDAAVSQTIKRAAIEIQETLQPVTTYGQMTNYGQSRNLLEASQRVGRIAT